VLESRARKYTLPYYEVLRAKMILLAAEGYSNDDIAAALSVGRDVVSLWRKRFFYEPTLTPAAPVADETCRGWRARTRFRHRGQQPLSVRKRVMTGSTLGRSTCTCSWVARFAKGPRSLGRRPRASRWNRRRRRSLPWKPSCVGAIAKPRPSPGTSRSPIPSRRAVALGRGRSNAPGSLPTWPGAIPIRPRAAGNSDRWGS
jgi:hypothetical protein